MSDPLSASFGPALRQQLAEHLERFPRRALEAPADPRKARGAAVAVALLPDPAGEPSFVLTQRAFHLPYHPGQFALPGGKIEEGEDAVQAALREMEEEISVRARPRDVLGLLDDFMTRSGFRITPVVIWLGEDPSLIPNPEEVRAIHRVPFAALDRPDVPILTPVPRSEHPILALPLVGTHVFAPTAAILYQAYEVLFQGRDTRVAHYEQPRFAWR